MNRREAELTTQDANRRIFPFEWGLEWLRTEGLGDRRPPLGRLLDVTGAWLEESRDFFRPQGNGDWSQDRQELTFPTPTPGPLDFNNTARCRIFEATGSHRAVVVVPQWNADEESHVGLCRILQRLGITAIRQCMPFHEKRRPPGMERADYMVSPNIGRTLHSIRQAVLELRVIVGWLRRQGYRRVGVMGTSLGSCVAYLAFAHDPDIRAGVFNHVSSFVADVVWKGSATRYVRWGLEGRIRLDDLRRCWAPVSPFCHIGKLRRDSRPHLLITAKYDQTFLPDLTRQVLEEYERQGLRPNVVQLPCGHYTTARFPFSYMDGWHICKFLRRNL